MDAGHRLEVPAGSDTERRPAVDERAPSGDRADSDLTGSFARQGGARSTGGAQ